MKVTVYMNWQYPESGDSFECEARDCNGEVAIYHSGIRITRGSDLEEAISNARKVLKNVKREGAANA